MLVIIEWSVENCIQIVFFSYVLYVCVVSQIGVFGIFANVHTVGKLVFALLKYKYKASQNFCNSRACRLWKRFCSLFTCIKLKFGINNFVDRMTALMILNFACSLTINITTMSISVKYVIRLRSDGTVHSQEPNILEVIGYF